MGAIEATVQRLRETLEAEPGVLEAYLFGSQARGDASEHSDIDVAVYVSPDTSRAARAFGYESELTAKLMAAVGSNRVDVVVLNDASPLLYHRVLRDGIRLFARDLVLTTTREGRALSRYCDYVPQLRKIEAAARARSERGNFGR
jgi:predicted nucleotidyltransferase